VKLRIISLDSERHRLGLSLKQAEDRPAPAPREERPRRDRGPRRERFDYRPEDATAEPEGGIDSTMAAAFASSGLLDQFRSEDAAPADEPTDAQAAPEAEAPDAVADAPADEPTEAEAAPEAEAPDAVADAPADEPTEAEAEASDAVADATMDATSAKGAEDDGDASAEETTA